jgi:hypothetical protein
MGSGCWVLMALRPAPIPPDFPPVLLVPLAPPMCPPVLLVSLGSSLVPSGPYGVSLALDPPACPPVPLVPLGSYSTGSIGMVLVYL